MGANGMSEQREGNTFVSPLYWHTWIYKCRSFFVYHTIILIKIFLFVLTFLIKLVIENYRIQLFGNPTMVSWWRIFFPLCFIAYTSLRVQGWCIVSLLISMSLVSSNVPVSCRFIENMVFSLMNILVKILVLA